jgi:peptide deformylase
VSERRIYRVPERVLKERAEEIGPEGDPKLAHNLVETMQAFKHCVGLAAPQIGVSKRAFALDVTGHPKATTSHGLVVMFDPLIIEATGRVVGREGCMSVPDLTANVARATEIVVRGRSPEGETLVIATDGFEARAFQHEIDHLGGLLILDRVESLSTDVFRRKTYK